MSDIIIKAENLGKKYIIGHQSNNNKYLALRDVMVQSIKHFWNSSKDLIHGKPLIKGDVFEEIWALKDINFEIERGEVVGIIGSNGAGKSTLLKVLSRITGPSAGRVTIKGRVASLLEVGTGFHPELTGRENIYLNGSILGMTQREINKKFDEIVSFAEVEKFLDTPVKRYSSGMYVRLAFAVAAHLEPEILVVDEVLAVGDTSFQKKCINKMDQVSQEGRTILFVSHNLAAINRLCVKSIWLQDGSIKGFDITEKIINSYLKSTHESSITNFSNKVRNNVEIISIYTSNKYDEYISIFSDDEEITVGCKIRFNINIRDFYIGIIIHDKNGANILFADSRDTLGQVPDQLKSGVYEFTIAVPPYLRPSHYNISIGIAYSSTCELLDEKSHVCNFEIINKKNFARTAVRPGYLNLPVSWQVTTPALNQLTIPAKSGDPG